MEFRKMRRHKQELNSAETIEIVKNSKVAILGVNGDGGYPYTVPINYVYADGKIYFHGAKAGHKIDAIKKDNRVSLSIIDQYDVEKERFTTNYRSISIFGIARILDTDEEVFYAAQAFGLKYNEDVDAVDIKIKGAWGGFCCVEVLIEHMTGKEKQ